VINEASQAGVFTLAAIALAVGVDVSQIPDVDGSTVAGGGAALAIMWVARGAFRRVDDLIETFKTIAEKWIEHTQRIENLHGLSLRRDVESVAIPSDSMETNTAPIPIGADL